MGPIGSYSDRALYHADLLTEPGRYYSKNEPVLDGFLLDPDRPIYLFPARHGGWVVAIEFTSLGNELPKYTGNIRQKISDVRGAGKGGVLENVQRAIEQVKEDIQKKEEEPRTKIKPKRRKLRKNISRSICGNRSSMLC